MTPEDRYQLRQLLSKTKTGEQIRHTDYNLWNYIRRHNVRPIASVGNSKLYDYEACVAEWKLKAKPQRAWTDSEVHKLKILKAKGHSTARAAIALGRTYSSVRAKWEKVSNEVTKAA